MANFLEIGVWCGKSAALSTMYARAEETCLFVDLAIREEVRSRLRSIKSEKMIFSQMPSSELPATGLLQTHARSFRWLNIDGEHSGQAVTDDLRVASELVSAKGVIIIDDFFSPAYPQITAATFRWLQTRSLEFQLFLCGYNKAYLCRSSAFRLYAQFIKDHLSDEMAARIERPLTIWKSTHPSDLNAFGIWEWADMKYRRPDWNRESIQI